MKTNEFKARNYGLNRTGRNFTFLIIQTRLY